MCKKHKNGITLVALVLTVVIIIILSMITINFLFGENGIVTKTQEAAKQSNIENTREKLEIATGTAIIDGQGTTSMDEYIDIIIKEEIVGSKEDVTDDDGDGVYEIITNNGFLFEATPVPDKDNAEDIILEYVGLATGPRIRKITATATTNSVRIEVEAVNAQNGLFTYEYKKNNEAEWQTAEETESNTCTINELEQNVIYDIRVTITVARGDNEGTASRETSIITKEMPTGAITFEEEIWQGDGTASVVVNTREEGYTIQYQIVETGSVTNPEELEAGNWQTVVNGGTVTGIEHNETVYARLWDGTNGDSYASASIIDDTNPRVTVTAEVTTSNSVKVSVQAVDNQSGMISSPTYTYNIKQTSQPESSYTTPNGASNITANSYTFTGLTQGTSYDVRVTVNGDKAGNTGTGYLPNQTTGTITGGEEATQTGAISFGSITWSGGKASTTVRTNTSYTIQYQVNSTSSNGWQTIANGGSITGRSHGDTIYARLFDGTNAGQYASASIIDNTNPQNATISLSSTNVTTGSTVRATVTHRDSESGPEITSCRYVWNTSSSRLGTNASSYTGGTFSSNGQQISRTMSSKGTYYLHVLTVDKAGNKWETVSSGVTVRQLVTSVSVSPSSATINVGSTRQLTATISPSSASNKSVTWSSSNSSIASVSSSGLVTAKAKGTATITATAKDGSGKKDTCSITVKQLATGITVSPTSATIEEGETRQLTATVSPTNANNRSVTWSSSNSNVASVSSSGLVTAKAAGTVTITATTADGSNKKATSSVTVTRTKIENVLEEGDYVYYYDASNTRRTCVVLYDSSSTYGVEIIAMNTVADIEFGNGTGSYQSSDTTYFNTAMNSYNNVISTLNTRASAYNNSTYSTRARSVGSVPNNVNSQSGYYTFTQFISSYSGQLRDTDTNYQTDWNQMGSLGIRDIDKTYWLASRYVSSISSDSSFYVRNVNESGVLGRNALCYVYYEAGTCSYSFTNGLRPVFKLKSGLKVTGGNGTSSSPYTLGK